MNSQLSTIDKELQEIQFQPLMEYERKIEHLANMNKMMASTYLRDFIIAGDIASQGLSRAIQLNMKAKASLDTYKSIAYLDKAPAFLSARGIKDTSAAREMYVDADADVIAAKDIYAKSEAVVSLLKSKCNMFLNAHHDVKKIAWGDDKMSGFEGM